MKDNFTPRSEQVLALAKSEAERFNHHQVGSEHLLLGLIKLGQGVAVNVLQRMEVDLDTVRSEIEKQVGLGSDQKVVGNIPYTRRLKKVLAQSGKEAKQLHHSYVGTEHILLGLLHEGEGVAARVLQSLEVNIQRTRDEILHELDPNLSAVETKEGDEANEPVADEKVPIISPSQLQAILAQMMKAELEGDTLDPTTLLDESLLRPSDRDGSDAEGGNKGEFFSAVCQAIRRILTERFRRRKRLEGSGAPEPIFGDEKSGASELPADEVLAVDAAIVSLEAENAELAKVAVMKFFGGMTIEQIAFTLDESGRTVERQWRAARAWLQREISDQE